MSKIKSPAEDMEACMHVCAYSLFGEGSACLSVCVRARIGWLGEENLIATK